MSNRGDRRRRKARTKTSKRPSGQASFTDGAAFSDDPHESLSAILDKLPRIIGSLPTEIAESSQMAGDRDAAGALINLPGLSQHYVHGSIEFLRAVHRTL